MDKAPDAFKTISEAADELDVPQHVLRFWETRFFQIKPLKRAGGRRYYRPEDVHLLKGIRVFLYGEGYTIRGVQRILKERGVKYVADKGRMNAEIPAASQGAATTPSPSSLLASDYLVDHESQGVLPHLDVETDRAFSRDVDPRSRDENAIGQKEGDSQRFNQNLKHSSQSVITEHAPLEDEQASSAQTSAPRIQERWSSNLSPSPRQLSAEDESALTGALVTLEECQRLLEAALA